MKSYPTIIAGGGLAGITLASRLSETQQPFLLIDSQGKKNTNDRTWCFWTQNPEKYQDILFHSWNKFLVSTTNTLNTLPLKPYTYCMIRSKDWYAQQYKIIEQNPNSRILKDTILSVDESSGIITTNQRSIQADSIYSSIPNAHIEKSYTLLQQSFLGWWVETTESYFDPDVATFMDFRTEQKFGTSFVYVLPVSKTKALVEYTIFSSDVEDRAYYANELTKYITEILVLSEYTITETEFGVIPMTDDPGTPLIKGRLTKIGTPGAYLKPTSGFGFIRTQHKSDLLLKNKSTKSQLKYRVYDSTLLLALSKDTQFGKEFFTNLFRKVSITTIFNFLDEETTLITDISIMIHFIGLTPYFIGRLNHIQKL